MIYKISRLLFFTLLLFFCIAYPLAVIGIAFNVKANFSLDLFGSALLFLQGAILLSAAILEYGWRRALLAGLFVIILSYIVETVGVNTGFPFGTYAYTGLLQPHLPGGVPLPVMFAWVLVVFGSYAWIKSLRQKVRMRGILLAALLAMLLDLAIEPVASYIVHYWVWGSPGLLNYYGVPLANFVAWFIVACVLLLLVDRLLSGVPVRELSSLENISRQEQSRTLWMATLAPRLLFAASLFMFGFIDLTHGYYWATLPALLAGVVISVLNRSSRVVGVPARNRAV